MERCRAKCHKTISATRQPEDILREYNEKSVKVARCQRRRIQAIKRDMTVCKDVRSVTCSEAAKSSGKADVNTD